VFPDDDLIRAGATLYFPPHGDSKPHLHFVVTDPDHGGFVVSVPVTTRREHSDTTVILQSDDHPWIQHESCASFKFADYRRVETLEKWIGSGRCRMHSDMSSKLLARIREGLLESPYTIISIKEYCRDKWDEIPGGPS